MGGLVGGHVGGLAALGPWAREEVGQGVGDAVHVGKLLVCADDILVIFGGFDVFGSADLRVGDVVCGLRGAVRAEEGVEAVGDALDLLDLAVLNGAELDDLAVGGREDGVGVGVEGTGAGLQGAVEEGGEVGVDVEVWLGDFVEADGVSGGVV